MTIDRTPPILLDLIERQIEGDKRQHPTISSYYFYLPNPVFTDKPEFIIVWQEPAIRPSNLSWMHDGQYLNFLFNVNDFIVHYCAFHFLCNRKYAYFMTDLSKGALLMKDADVGREQRYRDWKEILIKEIEHYGNPQLIAMGKGTTKRTLEAFELRLSGSVNHTSARWPFHREYSAPGMQVPEDIGERLLRFAGDTLRTLNYSVEMTNKIMERLQRQKKGVALKGRYIYYKREFETIRRHADTVR